MCKQSISRVNYEVMSFRTKVLKEKLKAQTETREKIVKWLIPHHKAETEGKKTKNQVILSEKKANSPCNFGN